MINSWSLCALAAALHFAAPEGQRFNNQINEASKNWWAFRPLADRPSPSAPPAGPGLDAEWLQNPIDAFIAAKLAEHGLQPNPPASRQELLRRITYDLIGLPPTLEERRAFESDDSPDAYRKVVERLLSSPHYGEKWGRHWLDLVRFSETNGYERDGLKPSAWRYRDYVIEAFNSDKPYDLFVREQIAGDELDAAAPDSIIATGFQRLGLWDDEPADPRQAYYDGLDDVVSTTGQVFLGLTIGCARCHDHKIDPIPQADYYRLMAYFHNTLRDLAPGELARKPYTLNTTVTLASGPEKEERERRLSEMRQEVDGLKLEIRQFEGRILASFSNPEKEDAKDEDTRRALLRKKSSAVLSESELQRYRDAARRLSRLAEDRLPPLSEALCIKENGAEAPDTFVLLRGNCHAAGEKVEPGVPRVLGVSDPPIAAPRAGARTSGRRSALADWLASPANPLTARVMANRIWQFHFGRGIVRSPSNFGQNGDPPTHPELLDWLAGELIRGKWSIKALHRRVVHSKAYRMSSRAQAAGLEKDPENSWFWRYDMRRLTAEEVRDSLLLLAGRLNFKMGGPSVYTRVPQEILATASRPDAAWGVSSDEEASRRSVYVLCKRSLEEPFLKSFDAADADSSCPVRFSTTVPTQALTLLNSAFSGEISAKFAERLRRDAPGDPGKQVGLALSLAAGRDPSPAEVEDGLRVLADMRRLGLDENKALERFCLLAINLNEFLYLD